MIHADLGTILVYIAWNHPLLLTILWLQFGLSILYCTKAWNEEKED